MEMISFHAFRLWLLSLSVSWISPEDFFIFWKWWCISLSAKGQTSLFLFFFPDVRLWLVPQMPWCSWYFINNCLWNRNSFYGYTRLQYRSFPYVFFSSRKYRLYSILFFNCLFILFFYIFPPYLHITLYV